MANKFHNPKTVALAGKYSLGGEVPAGSRVLYVSGQVGLDSKGKLGAGIDKQCDLAWRNIGQVLKAAGMTYRDIVKINAYVTDPRFMTAYREARGRYLPNEPFPASTLVIVSGLADPGMLVEVEVVAAK
ncbi:MAG: RidA family protein [Alphaproteobacteria bacterium]|nr:RidA family protein [Alphaproteobacteria bacterium]